MYFGKQINDVTTGRYPNGVGPFVEMIPTFAALNRNLKTGDVELQPQEFTLTVYPNPASRFVVVQSEKYFDRIELLDLLGRRIQYEETSHRSRSVLNLSDVRAGLYVLRVDGAAVRLLRIVK